MFKLLAKSVRWSFRAHLARNGKQSENERTVMDREESKNQLDCLALR